MFPPTLVSRDESQLFAETSTLHPLFEVYVGLKTAISFTTEFSETAQGMLGTIRQVVAEQKLPVWAFFVEE